MEYFEDIREANLLAAKQRWITSPNSVKNREPFGYINFTVAGTRLVRYANIVLGEDPTWIGCHYRIHIIWYHPNGYQCNYELSEHQEGRAFAIIISKNGLRFYKEETYPSYSLTQLHLNYIIA